MKTPFYAIKRAQSAVVTREAAQALADALAANRESAQQNLRELLNFCLPAVEDKVVPLTLGATVRMKPSADWHYTFPAAGEVCTVTRFTVGSGEDENEIKLTAVSDGDHNIVGFPNTVTDLSQWIEVL